MDVYTIKLGRTVPGDTLQAALHVPPSIEPVAHAKDVLAGHFDRTATNPPHTAWLYDGQDNLVATLHMQTDGSVKVSHA